MDDIIQELLDEIEAPTVTLNTKDLQKFLFKEMDRINHTIGEGVSPRSTTAKMSALVRKVKTLITAETEAEKIEQLLDVFYRQLGFSCRYDEYFKSDRLSMNKVLTTKKGMPISLAAIVLYLASHLELPLYAVNFPTQLILRAEIKEKNGRTVTRFINPWNGEFLTHDLLEKWLEGEVNAGMLVTPELTRRATPYELLERVETLFKMALTREKKYQEVLDMINFRLIFSPDDPYEIRDRGMIFASLNCYQAAYEDLTYFIDQCPDDPSAMMLKMEMQGLEEKSKEMIIH